MLRDVELFRSRLGKIDGFEGAGDHLENIINSKQVKAVPPAPAPAPEPTPSPPTAQLAPSSPTIKQEGEVKEKPAEQSAELQAQIGVAPAVATPAGENGDSSVPSKA
jgi:vacuolar protein sorting-associated protein 54